MAPSVFFPVAAVRVFLFGLFAVSGILKASSLRAFARTVRTYELLPSHLVEPLAISITLVELLIACLLAGGVFMRFAAIGASVLLLLFAAAMSMNLLRGRKSLDCGCFGMVGAKIHWNLVVRNCVIATVVLYLVLVGKVPAREALTLDISVLYAGAVLLVMALISLLFDLATADRVPA